MQVLVELARGDIQMNSPGSFGEMVLEYGKAVPGRIGIGKNKYPGELICTQVGTECRPGCFSKINGAGSALYWLHRLVLVRAK
jgi:hypothetical protein